MPSRKQADASERPARGGGRSVSVRPGEGRRRSGGPARTELGHQLPICLLVGAEGRRRELGARFAHGLRMGAATAAAHKGLEAGQGELAPVAAELRAIEQQERREPAQPKPCNHGRAGRRVQPRKP